MTLFTKDFGNLLYAKGNLNACKWHLVNQVKAYSSPRPSDLHNEARWGWMSMYRCITWYVCLISTLIHSMMEKPKSQ